MTIIRHICTTPNPGPMPAGRVCARPQCGTILNRYNPSDHCNACVPMIAASKREQLDALGDLIAEMPRVA